MVVVAVNQKSGQKGIKTKWPVVVGLTAGTTKQQGQNGVLEPEKSLVKSQKWGGL